MTEKCTPIYLLPVVQIEEDSKYIILYNMSTRLWLLLSLIFYLAYNKVVICET